MKKWILVLCAISVLHNAPLTGQTTPFLSFDEINMLVNEISGDRAYEHIRVLSAFHRNSGGEGYFKSADYVMEAAKKAGLVDVSFIEQEMSAPNYDPVSAELWMVEPFEYKLADLGDHTLHLADGSRSADVTAELIWIGDGSLEALEGKDLTGKIVLTTASPYKIVKRVVYDMGAAGIVTCQSAEDRSPMDFPDQLAWSFLPSKLPDEKPGTFAFVVSPRVGDKLHQILGTFGMQDVFAYGKPTPGGRIVVKAKVNTRIGSTPGKTGFVEGWIRGSKYSDQQIVITAHLQEEQGSANDDGSGCANMLELARALNKLIAEGKIPQPLRDIRFWWTDEIFSEYDYFGNYQDEPGKMLVNLHQDMTGARQSMGSRVQHLIFAPHSRTSYLDAVFESIGTYVIQTNNAFLSAGRAGEKARPHSKAIYSTRGSKEGFNAAFVPYFGQSDYMCFVEGIIGVPATGQINWDDVFIHSSDDDLFQIDQTQLKRNNFIVGGMALFLAYAGEEDIPVLAGETFAFGSKRSANDLKAALELIQKPVTTPDEAWADALFVIEEGAKRERMALNSVRVFSNKKDLPLIDELAKSLDTRLAEMRKSLQSSFKSIHKRMPVTPGLTDFEKKMQKKIPVNPKDLKLYFETRRQVSVSTDLHGIMKAEVYNFVDGKKSYYDIYRAVKAEALAVGDWYYGSVTLEDVTAVLNAAVDAGALTLK